MVNGYPRKEAPSVLSVIQSMSWVVANVVCLKYITMENPAEHFRQTVKKEYTCSVRYEYKQHKNRITAKWNITTSS